MARTVASLGGIPLEMDQALGWTLQPGPTAFVQAIEMRKEAADALLANADPVDLELPGGDGGAGFSISRLYVVDEAPGTHPDRRKVLVADRRIWFPFRAISRAYNVRRVTGDQFVAAGTVEVPTLAAAEKYAVFSLREQTEPWTAKEMAEDILEALAPGEWSIRSSVPDVPIEDVRIEGPGDVALSQVLRILPGFSVYVSPRGQVVLYNTVTGDDNELTEAGLITGLSPFRTRTRATRGRPLHFPLAPGSRTADWPIESRRVNMRARSVRVLFDARFEFVCTYNEVGETSTRTPAQGSSEILCRNVCTVSDPILRAVEDVDGFRTDKAQGSLAEFGDASTYGILRAWELGHLAGNNPRMTGEGLTGALTQEVIRKHYASGFAFVQQEYVEAEAEPNPVWAGRMARVRSDWRQAFRVDPFWWGRMENLETFRVAIVDSATGSRSPSPAFMDYVLRPSHLGIVRGTGDAGLDGRLQHGVSITMFSGTSISVTGLPTTPLRAVAVAPGAGAFRVMPAPDPTGEWDLLIPGKPAGDLPTIKVDEWNKNLLQALAAFDQLELSPNFAMRTILTATRAFPPTEERLYSVEIFPSDLSQISGLGSDPGAGPTLEIRIPPSLLTAEYAWDDAAGFASISEALTTPAPLDPATLSNKFHLDAVARAVATAYYESIRDRQETAGAETPMDPSAEPAGVVAGVRHEVRPDGAAVTLFTSPKQTPQIGDRMWRFLPESTRNLLLRTLPRG